MSRPPCAASPRGSLGAVALASALGLTACTTATPTDAGHERAAAPAPAPAAAPAAPGIEVTSPWFITYDKLMARCARPEGDELNARRVPLAALPGTVAIEHLGILSSLRDQLRARHDQVWLLLNQGEGNLGLASAGHHLIAGSIVFVPAGAVHYFTTEPKLESTFLTFVGPDLARDDTTFPEGERPAPQATPAGGPNLVPAAHVEDGKLQFTPPGLVVLWVTERNRLMSEVQRSKTSSGHMLYANRYLTLSDAAVCGGLDLTNKLDQSIVILETPEAPQSPPRLVIGDKSRPLHGRDNGDVMLVPGGTKVRIEGGTPEDPVFVLVVQPTDVNAEVPGD